MLPPRDAGVFRSRGGGDGGSSSSSSSTLGLEAAFFGFAISAAAGMRSLGSRRRSASAAARPNRGSLRPPLFFRPHAIRDTPAPLLVHANAPDLRAGYVKVNA